MPTKKDLGKPKKRKIERADIDAQTPFHWGYVFDDIVQRRGGFDIILANPPWEVFKPQAKEFFAEHSDLVSKNKMTIKEFEKEQAKLLQNAEVREAWLAYENRFPHINKYFRTAPEYAHQIAVVDGKKIPSDLNLYKLFLERCFELARPTGQCGIVIPSGIYTDLGAKGLRDMLFEKTQIEGLFCFENRKEIFEGVDSRFKFVVLTFEKSSLPRLQAFGEANSSAPPNDLLAPLAVEDANGGGTQRFAAAFMRLNVEELARFPEEGAIEMSVELIKRLSPDSHSMMEFKSELDIAIVEKLLRFPSLGQRIENTWNLQLTREFHMTDDAFRFKTSAESGCLPLFTGKMFHQFEPTASQSGYWIDEAEGRKMLLKGDADVGQKLDYQGYRWLHRRIARNTDTRTLIATITPPNVFTEMNSTTMNVGATGMTLAEMCCWCAISNSFVLDWILRQSVTTTLNMFYLYQLPVPRLRSSDKECLPLAQRAARLICTTPDFDDLAKSVGLKGHQDGATDPTERAKLRAELDGLVAHLYGLSETEFTHILGTFPLVAEPVKVAALNAWRDVARGLIQ